MCGAYGFSIHDAKEVYDRFDVVNQLDDLHAALNLRPGQLNPVITSHSPNRISRMFWGLIPHWAKDEKRKFSTINAKAETAAELPTYRDAVSTASAASCRPLAFMNRTRSTTKNSPSPGITSD